MSLLTTLPDASLSPSRFWTFLPQPTRLLAARALYAHDWGDGATKREADLTIMRRMNFREQAVRQLPVDRRANYLATSARPDDSLASSLLLALHLEHRRPMLGLFLDTLGIQHEGGLIAEEHEIEPPSEASLAKAADAIVAAHGAADAELYLLTLLVLDPRTWAGLEPWLTARKDAAVKA